MNYIGLERRNRCERRCLAPLVVSAMVIPLLLGACPILPDESSNAVATSEPLEQEPRDWRMVFVFLDDNDLRETADYHQDRIGDYPDRLGRTHRLILRESTRDGRTVALATGDGITHVTLPDLPAGSYLQPETLAATIAILRREFPARQQAIFLAGHGRGWRGVGFSDSDPRAYVGARELARLPGSAPEEYTLLVLDAGWSAFAELLQELRDEPVEIALPSTDLRRSGIDYAGLLETFDSGDWSPESVRDHVRTGLRDAAQGSDPVILDRRDLAELPDYLDELAAAATTVSGGVVSQEQLQSFFMERAEAVTLPGDAHVTLGDVADVPEIAALISREERFDRVFLHLVSLDELGLPAGHSPEYRSGTEIPDSPETPRFFSEIDWAPDLFGRSGFLFELWYREY